MKSRSRSSPSKRSWRGKPKNEASAATIPINEDAVSVLRRWRLVQDPGAIYIFPLKNGQIPAGGLREDREAIHNAATRASIPKHITPLRSPALLSTPWTAKILTDVERRRSSSARSDMLTTHIDLVLYITGGITMSMFLLFLAPRWCLRTFYALTFDDDPAIFFVRSWGGVVTMFGVLLVWAGHDPALRVPMTLTAAVAKGVVVVMIFQNLASFTRRMLPVAVFDVLCVLLYAGYLAGL